MRSYTRIIYTRFFWLYLHATSLQNCHNRMITFTPEHTSKQSNDTPLRVSVERNHVEIVRMLLDAGAEQIKTNWVRGNMVGLE